MKGSSTVAVKGPQANPKPLKDDLPHLEPWRAPLARALRYLLGLQKPDGHWVGELQGDTILESEFILLMAFLGREDVLLRVAAQLEDTAPWFNRCPPISFGG